MPLTVLFSSSTPSPKVLQHHHRKKPIDPKQTKPPASISLLRGFVHSGRLQDARKLFDEMPDRTPASWTILMNGYIQQGHAAESLSLLSDMMNESSSSVANSQLDPFVISVGLKACASVSSIEVGRKLHCSALKLGCMEDLFVANALVTMYSVCGFLRYAESVFRRISMPDLVSWSSILSGFVMNGHEDEAMTVFLEMAGKGIRFDDYVLSIGLKVFAAQNCIGLGVQVHSYIIKMGSSSSFLCNTLIEFYGKIGKLGSMRKAFDETSKDLVAWNTVISCYAQSVCCEEALVQFSALMGQSSSECDNFTLGSVLHSVTRLKSMRYGKQVHGYVIRAGFGSDSYVMSSLLDMYIKCSIQDCLSFKLLRHFWSFGIELDEFIAASTLKLCALNQELEVGKMLHSLILKLGLELDPFMISSLIDMYAKCGVLGASVRVFFAVPDPGTVPWSAIIAAHCWNSEFEEALFLFREMQLAGVSTNEFTYTSVLFASIALGDFQSGIQIHCNVIRCGYGVNSSVVNTLINLYLELRLFQRAVKLSFLIPSEEISWDSFIQAFGKAEEHEQILKVFHKIQQIYGHLDHRSACFVLNACRSPVLLNAGTQAHAYITKRGLLNDPSINSSLVNMYSCSGSLRHAVDAFDQLPEKNSASWTSIISAYVYHDHPAEAITQFLKMIRKGKSPDSKTFISVLKAYGQMDLVDEAFRLFTSMVEVYKIIPSVEIYSSMVEVLSCVGMLQEAEHFIESAIPFKPSASVWRTLLSSCQSNGNIKVAKLAAQKLVELEPCGCTKMASALESETLTLGSSWIEAGAKVIEFVSGQIVMEQVSSELMEIERKMVESGYNTDNYQWLQSSEEYKKNSFHHSELMALAYGLVYLPQGAHIRVVKMTRMCEDCHSAFKLISTFVGRDILVKDSCKFHHFKDGACSCKDKW